MKKNRIHNLLTEKDTLYILFDSNSEKMNKYKASQYNYESKKYYRIIYDFPIYWKEEISKEFAEETYGKEYVKKNGIKDTDYLLFEGDFNHSFWYGTYKVFPEYPEFDDSQIYGSSDVLKKHKSFLTKHKNKIIDYSWFKNRTPPNVWKIFKPYKLNKNKPTLYLIDKNEYTKDSIILRNVVYHQEVIE